MNECEYASRLNAYHDGEMAPGDCIEFERHLRQCPPCAQELERLQRLTTLLNSLAGPELSPAAMDRWHRAVDRLPRNGIVRFVEALAAIAAMILLGCILSLSQQSPAQAATGAMPVWESDAVSQPAADSATEGSDDSLVRWTVQDLSRKGEAAHD